MLKLERCEMCGKKRSPLSYVGDFLFCQKCAYLKQSQNKPTQTNGGKC
jgi:hypothetical protein